MQHALQAQDVERATRVIEQRGLAIALQGHMHTVLGWLRALPEPHIRVRPALCVLYATILISTNQLDAAEPWLRDAEQGHAVDLSDEQAHSVRGQVALLPATLAYTTGDLVRAVALAQQALDVLPETEVAARAAALVSTAQAYRVTGDVTRMTEHRLQDIRVSTRASGNLLAYIVAATNLAELHMWQGRLRQAAATYREVAEVASGPLGLQMLVNGAAYFFGMGNLLYEWNDLEAAQSHLTQGMEMVRGALTVTPASITQGYLALARLQQARGDPNAAHAALDAFDDLARQRHFAAPLMELGAVTRAQLWLAQGQPSTAARWADASGLYIDDMELPFLREGAYLTFARVQIAVQQDGAGRGASRNTADLLDRLLTAADAVGRLGSVIEILTLRALAFVMQGDTRQALTAIARALTLAAPEGYVRTFVNEGAPMAALLTLVVEHASPVAGYAATLLNAFPSSEALMPAGAILHPQSSTLVEPLSERELDVLRLIADGHSNQAIADRLIVAVSTVKRHINNLYGKLDVQSRTQALVRARELHLL